MSTPRSTLLPSRPKLCLGKCTCICTSIADGLLSSRIRSVLLYNKMGLLLGVFEKEYKAMMGQLS